MTSKARSSQIPLINFIRENSSFSRRDIMAHLTSGHIQVNHVVITDATHLVSLTDSIVVHHTHIYKKNRCYYKFNKPTNVISTFNDPKGRKDLSFYLKKHQLSSTLRPCGRLDRDSTGLLLFSNDGNFINHILHPSFSIPKIYEIKLNKPLTPTHKTQLINGIFLPDGPVSIHFKDSLSDQHFIVRISIGRNRILRRSFEFFGYETLLLHRQSIGSIELANLPSGEFEELPLSVIKTLVLD